MVREAQCSEASPRAAPTSQRRRARSAAAAGRSPQGRRGGASRRPGPFTTPVLAPTAAPSPNRGRPKPALVSLFGSEQCPPRSRRRRPPTLPARTRPRWVSCPARRPRSRRAARRSLAITFARFPAPTRPLPPLQAPAAPIFGAAATFGAGGGFGGFAGLAAKAADAPAALGGGDAAAAAGDEDGDEPAPEEECKAEFKPLVQLEEVEVTSGEEDEEALFD